MSNPGLSMLRDPDDIRLGEVLATLWRGKWLIVMLICCSILAGGVYTYFFTTPTFQSTAVVMLNNRQESVVDLESVIGNLGADTAVVNTEVQILSSRSLLGKVVDRLDLTLDPEFNTMIRPPGTIDRMKDAIKSAVPGWSTPDALTAEEYTVRERAGTIYELLQALSIRNVPQSLVFEITAETSSARKSALIVDTLSELYILDQLEVKFEATEQATSWLSDRVSQLQTELEAAEARVKDFRAETDLINPDALAGLERQLKDVRERLQDTRLAHDAAEAKVAALQAAQTPRERAAVAEDTQLTQFLPRVSDPAIARAFETRFQQVLTRTQLELERSDNQIAVLSQSQQEFEARIAQQSDDLITLQQLTREAEASRLLYEYFLSRLKEMAAQQGVQQADSRILSTGVVPATPSGPRRKLILGMGGFLGLVLGTLIVLLRSNRQTTFVDAQTLEQETGHTVLGQLPLIPGKRRIDKIRYLVDRPASIAAEAVRDLRTSLLATDFDNPPQVIMTSSSLPAEGKTTVALALAVMLAGMNRNKKLLLIEGDIRLLVLRSYIGGLTSGGVPDKGLVSLMNGDARLDEAVCHLDKVGFDILLGEKTRTNAADLFESERFAVFLDEMRKQYDHIIIDTAPVLIVPDGRIVGRLSDAVVFVVNWNRTQRREVREALAALSQSGCRVAGLVLNRIHTGAMKRYGYSGRYGYGRNDKSVSAYFKN